MPEAVETLHCPTCLSRLLDGGETRCPRCGAPISTSARPLPLLERELQARIEAETAAHFRDRRRAAKVARRIAALPPTTFDDCFSRPVGEAPAPQPRPGSSVIVDLPATAVHEVTSTRSVAEPVAPAVVAPIVAPIPEEPIVAEPIVEAPIVAEPIDEPIVEEAAVEEATPEEPLLEEPLLEEPLLEEPHLEEPLLEEPLQEEPAVETAPAVAKVRKRRRVTSAGGRMVAPPRVLFVETDPEAAPFAPPHVAEPELEPLVSLVSEPAPEQVLERGPEPVVEPARATPRGARRIRAVADVVEPVRETKPEPVAVPSAAPSATPAPIARIGTQGTNAVWRDRVFNSANRPPERASWPRPRPQPQPAVAPVIDLPAEPVISRIDEAG